MSNAIIASQVIRIAVLFLLAQMPNTVLSQQCTNGGSETSILGWKLQRHIYKTLMADLGLECVLMCRRDDRCQSFNWVISLSMCEFSDRTKEARPEDFVPDPDRYYFTRDMNRVPLGSIPELPAETCKEIKASEGQAVSKKYWLSTIKPGIPVLAHCDMKTEDINECSVSPSVCDVNANCRNNVGSYVCLCKPGFSGDGKTCKDINECSVSPSVCHINANCQNNVGSYVCSCKPGFSGDGKTCQDINECSVSPSVCHINANCQNNVGSYVCSCKPGFRGDGKTCQDINECSVSPSDCHINANCQNNVGSYVCSCKPGFRGDGKTCQVSSCHGIKQTSLNGGDGVYTISLASSTVQVYCDMTSSHGWTLIARFSNNDAKNWMGDAGYWWYDRNTAFGGSTDPSSNTDMISPAFWLFSGSEFKITRSDDTWHNSLLQTTGDCLGGQTFRSKITSYGNFRSGNVWASDKCLGNCTVQYGGQYRTTEGFQQATCSGNIQSAHAIGFWCDWSGGDGAVMMIGGGGKDCARADHGIAITEADEASFVDANTQEFDFGNEASSPTNSYSLNLWVR